MKEIVLEVRKHGYICVYKEDFDRVIGGKKYLDWVKEDKEDKLGWKKYKGVLAKNGVDI